MKCLYCLKEKRRSEFSREHIIPQQLGKFDFPTIQICRDCNTNFSNEFENFISNFSTIKKIVKGEVSVDTINDSIEEFSQNVMNQKFILKICFNFLYLLLPKSFFYDLNKSAFNSINLMRNLIYGRVTFGNDNIKILIPTNLNISNYRDQYNIAISNNAIDKSGNRHLEIQFDLCNCFTIKFPLNIITTNDIFAYIFTFKKDDIRGNVEIFDFQKGTIIKWNNKVKREFQEEFSKRIIINDDTKN